MAGKTRVPTTIPQFNTYINTTDNHIAAVSDPGPPPVTNGQRLGLSAENITDWHDQRVFWRDTLYPKYSNPDTKTKTVNQQVKNFMKEFSEFTRPLLTAMSVHPDATEQDEAIFNFVITRDDPTRPTTPIQEQCFASIKPLGGGMVRLSCRSQQDTQRASLPPGADSVQVADKIGEPPPSHPEDGTEITLITKATSTQELGPEHVGTRVYAFFRWFNTKYPDLAGPWSERVSFVVA